MPKPLKTQHTVPPTVDMARPLEIFVPITKIDSAKRLVYGTFSAESPDKSGEVLDYKTGKDAFQRWSDDMYAASKGKSKGNVREMHGKNAVGRVEDMKFDDENKKVLGVVKVVDDATWAKVEEGVLNGFSIGGGYARRWTDPNDGRGVTRYTPTLSEVSLVDNPCLAEATFEFVKADGLTEVRTIHRQHTTQTQENTDMSTKNDKALAKTNVTATSKQGWQALDGSFHETKAEADTVSAAHLAKSASAPMEAALAKAAASVAGLPSLIDGGDGLPDAARGETAENKEGVLSGGMDSSKGGHTAQSDNAGYSEPGKDVKKGDMEMADGADKKEKPAEKGDGGTETALGHGDGYGKPVGEATEDKDAHYGVRKKDYSTEERKKMADSGEAMEDGSYPIKDKKDLKNAVQAFGRAKDKDKAKAHIKSRAKALGGEDHLPDDWTKAAEKTVRMDKLRKSLHDAGRLAHLLQDLAWLKDCLTMEAKMEGDGSKIPGEIENIMRATGQTLESLVSEEVGELFDDPEDEDTEVVIMELAAGTGELRKFVDGKVTKATPKENGLYKLSGALEKAGRRHSKSDQERLQGMHDTAHDMHKVLTKCLGHMGDMVKAAGDVKNTAVDMGADGEKLPAFDPSEASRTNQKADFGGDLQKAFGERDALSKAFLTLTPQVEKMAETIETLAKSNSEYAARLKKIEDQPLPAKGAVRAVTKAMDGGGAEADPAAMQKSLEETIAAMTPEQRSMLLVKAAKLNPVRS